MFSRRITTRPARSIRFNAPNTRPSFRRYVDVPRVQGLRTISHEAPSDVIKKKAESASTGVWILTTFAAILVGLSCLSRPTNDRFEMKNAMEHLELQFKERVPPYKDALWTIDRQIHHWLPFIPAGYPYLRRLYFLHRSCPEEVEKLVGDTYARLFAASRMDTKAARVSETWSVLTSLTNKATYLSGYLCWAVY